MAVELVLIRHGATVAGDRLVGGQSDPTSSAEGHDQARRVADRLAAERIDGLFVTPLRRTADTAAPIAALAGRSPVVIEELAEVHLGDREATLATTDGRRDLMRAVFAADRWDVAPGAESMTAFGERVTVGLRRLAEAVTHAGCAVAVVHGGVIAEACRHATGSRPLAFLPALRHTSITRLRLDEHGLGLRVFNDTSHLDGC